MRFMKSYVVFLLVSLVCLVVGVPLWIVVFAPQEASFSVFTDTGFWLSIGIGLVFLFVGFWFGNRADIGQ